MLSDKENGDGCYNDKDNDKIAEAARLQRQRQCGCDADTMVATGGVRKYEDTANTIVTMTTMMTVYMHEDNGEIDDVARRQRQRQC